MIKRAAVFALVGISTAFGTAYPQSNPSDFLISAQDGGSNLGFQLSCNKGPKDSRDHGDYHYSACANLSNSRDPNPSKHTAEERTPDFAIKSGEIILEATAWLHNLGLRRIKSTNGNLKVMIHPGGVAEDKSREMGKYITETGVGQDLKAMWLYMGSAEAGQNHELRSVIAHELFHGAQHAYDKMIKQHSSPVDPKKPEDDPDPEDWFIEATAEYVGEYFIRMTDGKGLNPLRERNYLWPLTDVDRSVSDGGYATATFYAALARRMSGDLKTKGLRSLTVEAMNPAYLGRVMEHMNSNTSSDLLDDFDKALAATGPFGQGLYRLYPEVMRDFTYGPDHNIGREKFPFIHDDAPKNFHRIKIEESAEWVWEDSDTAQKLSTEFYFVDSDKLSDDARLLVELEPVEGSEARAPDLHLLVEGAQFSSLPEIRRNRMILRKTDKPAIIGVANVSQKAAASTPLDYKLKVTWLEGGTCDYDAIYASTDFGEHRKAMLENDVPPSDVKELYASMYPTPDRYLEEYGKRTNKGLNQPDIHPDIAYLSISSQGMTAGGDGCAHHLASSTLLETELMGNPAGLPSARTQGKEIARDLTRIFGALNKAGRGKEPSFKSPNRSGINRLYRRMKGAFGWDARDGSVMVTVFSPNLYGFWQGHAAYAGEGPMIDSRGGWGPKESAAVTIMLPGTQVKDLEEGRVYPAISVGAAMGGPLPILSRWTGVWTTKLGPEGTFDMLMPQQLSGYVQIEKIEGGRVYASFNLNGHGTHTRTIRYKEDNGEQEIMVEKDVSPGATPIFVSGEFTAPIVTTGMQIYRNMYMQRSVSRTREGR